MCGITVSFAYHPDAPPIDCDALRRVRDRMISRGPDGFGEWFSEDGRVGMGHRRLAIVDLSARAAQPMKDEDSGLAIVFNGEIYNYREIRAALEKKGYKFATESDTEVLLKLYCEKGRDMVSELRGMYAFALWDGRKKGLFVARDTFGIKPLYLADDGRTIRLASQVKALLAGGEVDTSPDPAGHTGFFLWGHLPEPYTLYRGIRAFPPGTSLWLDASGRRKPEDCLTLEAILRRACGTEDNCNDGPASLLRNLLLDSVERHLVADIPVGFFLSSGLDSTTLVALSAEKHRGDIHTVTLGFEEYRGTEKDEVPLAEVVARRYGTNHRTIRMKKKDFMEEFDRLIESMDQPTIDGVNTYFVSRAAREAGLKAVISGVGGDELFGGYPSFRQIPKSVKWLRAVKNIPAFGKAFRYVSAPLARRFTSPKYAGLLEYGGTFGGAYLLRRGMFMPWELQSLLPGGMVREGLLELQTLNRLDDKVRDLPADHLKVSALEMNWYLRNQLLRDSDWAGMAHSIEIRTPLVDTTLFSGLVPLLGRENPPDKQAMALTPQTPLSTEIMSRPKSGFNVPMREWLLNEKLESKDRGLRAWAKEVYRLWQNS